MYDVYDNEFGVVGFRPFPARQTLVGFGYDPDCYISTSKTAPSPYVTQQGIIAKIGGLNRLIEACDDSQPPTGSLNPNQPPNNPAYLTYLAVIQNVVTEINGYLSSIYPLPLVQTGTVAVLRVLTVDDTGSVLTFEILEGGNYAVAPNTNQNPVYLRHIDPLANSYWFGENWQQCQAGSGFNITVTYQGKDYSDESGQVLQAQTISGTPVIVSGGLNYKCGELVVLTGGQSFVPAKVREAALILICHSFYQRRLAPEEKNIFDGLAKMWREKLTSIGDGGDEQLDGTYKRFYSAGQSWNTKSVLFGANSL